MSSAPLTPVSYLILGLVARGASTPYELKQHVARSVAYFWAFPHSQFYSEPARLQQLGLLHEEREDAGRRRRHYTITAPGREALSAWLREPTYEQPQIRDTGLLKLFFGEGLTQGEVAALARAQAAAHGERLSVYEAIDGELPRGATKAFPRATLQLGLALERAFVQFWSQLATDPAGTLGAREIDAADG